jgi:Uma2 family endonuclease
MVISHYNNLPTAEDLPQSDETPVDNELQNDIPNLLLQLLRSIWAERNDWFFGVDMGVYYEPDLENYAKSKCIVPDGFLAVGVPRYTGEQGRLSYVLWQEQVLPILVLEVVSDSYNSEYENKLALYEKLGILYYVIYNPKKRGKYKQRQSLEVYRLENHKYQLLESVLLLKIEGTQSEGRMVWLTELEIGIGCEQKAESNWQREWLYWYDRNGFRYLSPEEKLVKAELAINQERAEKERLIAYLKNLGIDPNQT